jgi:hypothetical protein
MKFLALDTNLSVLFCLGNANRKNIGVHSRISSYSFKDFDLLCEIISAFDRLIMTPYAFAEISNILNISAKRHVDSKLIMQFQQLAIMADEISIVTQDVVQDPAFQIFGLTDAAWTMALNPEIVFYSADAALVRYMADRNIQAQWFPPCENSAN